MSQVMEDGQLSVLNCSPAPSSLAQNEEEPEEEDGEMAEMNVKHREHCPRWANIYHSTIHVFLIYQNI